MYRSFLSFMFQTLLGSYRPVAAAVEARGWVKFKPSWVRFDRRPTVVLCAQSRSFKPSWVRVDPLVLELKRLCSGSFKPSWARVDLFWHNHVRPDLIEFQTLLGSSRPTGGSANNVFIF